MEGAKVPDTCYWIHVLYRMARFVEIDLRTRNDDFRIYYFIYIAVRFIERIILETRHTSRAKARLCFLFFIPSVKTDGK